MYTYHSDPDKYEDMYEQLRCFLAVVLLSWIQYPKKGVLKSTSEFAFQIH